MRAMASDSRPRIFATRSLPGPAFERLGAETDLQVWQEAAPPAPEQLREACTAAEGLLCILTDRVDEALYEAAPRLRVVSSCSVGVDHVDMERATKRGIPVGHTPGVLTETTADLAFALLLAAARRVAEADRFVREGRWRAELGWQPDLLLGRDLYGACLGIVGLGAIGRAVARRAAGFGMRVLGWNRTPRDVSGVEAVPLAELLRRADFVSVHVALSSETRGLLGAVELGRMRPGAVLVNTARGGVVDESALEEALRSGRLAAAGLDVFAEEPLPSSSGLLRLPNVVFTPHIGSASIATRERMTALAVENLLAGLRGEPLPRCANPAVYAGRLAPGAGPAG